MIFFLQIRLKPFGPTIEHAPYMIDVDLPLWSDFGARETIELVASCDLEHTHVIPFKIVQDLEKIFSI